MSDVSKCAQRIVDLSSFVLTGGRIAANNSGRVKKRET